MEKLEAIKVDDIHIGCLTCSSVQRVASLETVICVGFGSAIVTRNGDLFYDGEEDCRNEKEPKSIRDIEEQAALSPNDDWRVVMYGPLHGEMYQRQEITKDLKCGPLSDDQTSTDKRFAWVMVESNQGFA
jgi:hypothetical protein